MIKRIFAWILLAGFVLLILNIIVFRYYWQLSVIVYLIIAVAFILTNGRRNSMQDQKFDISSNDSDKDHSCDDSNTPGLE